MKNRVFFFGLTVLALTFTSCTETSLEDDNQELEQMDNHHSQGIEKGDIKGVDV